MSVKERLKAKRIVTPVVIAGDTFHVRALTLGELDSIDARAKEFPDDHNRKVAFGTCLAALSVCDENGGKVFDDIADPDVQDISTDVLRDLVDAAAKVNGLGGSDDAGND